MQVGNGPRVKTSKKRVIYTHSSWCVNNFEIWSGEALCRAAALRVEGALLFWLGKAGGDQPLLGEVALAMPPDEAAAARGALATSLLGAEGSAVALARRLAAALAKPVYVCCGATFDRFTMPLVERGLIAEIKSRPEFF